MVSGRKESEEMAEREVFANFAQQKKSIRHGREKS